MGNAEFPLGRIHATAAASCICWFAVSLAAHMLTAARWKGYSSLRRSERLQWCNKIACGIHAAVLVWHQAGNLGDPVLNADPLHAVTPSHFLWASVLFGYLAYDTLYSLLFFSWRSGAAFLLHHVVGLAGCALGLYANKLSLFGMAIEVFFEATTPLLHVLGCLKLAGQDRTRAYSLLGLAFTAQFFVCRVVVANAYFARLFGIVAGLMERPWWAWAGVAVFGLLNALNLFWFAKLLRMAAGSRQSSKRAAGAAVVAGGAHAVPQQTAQAQHAAVAQHAGAGLVHRSHLGLEKVGTSGGGRPVLNVMAFPGTKRAP